MIRFIYVKAERAFIDPFSNTGFFFFCRSCRTLSGVILILEACRGGGYIHFFSSCCLISWWRSIPWLIFTVSAMSACFLHPVSGCPLVTWQSLLPFHDLAVPGRSRCFFSSKQLLLLIQYLADLLFSIGDLGVLIIPIHFPVQWSPFPLNRGVPGEASKLD